MPFRVEFAEIAAEKFRKLDKNVRDRISTKLRKAARNPGRHVSSMRGVDAFRSKIGDYRLTADID